MYIEHNNKTTEQLTKTKNTTKLPMHNIIEINVINSTTKNCWCRYQCAH